MSCNRAAAIALVFEDISEVTNKALSRGKTK